MNEHPEQIETLLLMFATAMGILAVVTITQKTTDYFKKRKAKKNKK